MRDNIDKKGDRFIFPFNGKINLSPLPLLAILLLNGAVSFLYAILTADDPTIPWALLTVNFLFYTGIAQAGITFSAIMRITKAEWGRPFSRMGEIMTLSSAPVSVILFAAIYAGGIDHIFYWASEDSTQPFFWINILAMAAFYIASYLYFTTGGLKERGAEVSYDIGKRLNILAALVLASYIILNTSLAWYFGMTIIPHWESSTFPPYYWVGNIFAGTAFLFLFSILFPCLKGSGAMSESIRPMGKLLLGYTLLWIYMFWAQFIVIWYGDIPRLTEPLLRPMRGNYRLIFSIMIITAFILPFLFLMQRRVRASSGAIATVAVMICTGLWLNRYLMLIPLFSDGSRSAALTWTGLSLTTAGLAATLLAIIFPFLMTNPFGGRKIY